MKFVGLTLWILAALMTAQWVVMIRSYVRTGRGITQQTVNTAMLFALATLAVPALPLSPFHLLWLVPASWLLGTLSLVFPLSLLSLPGHFFGQLCCVGLFMHRQEGGNDLINAASERDVAHDLRDATSAADLPRVKALLAAKADVNSRTGIGVTPLIIAAQDGHPETVRVLLAAKADVNAKIHYDKGDFTALMLASGYGHLDVVRELLAANADVNAKTGDGITALMLASGKGHLEVVQL